MFCTACHRTSFPPSPPSSCSVTSLTPGNSILFLSEIDQFRCKLITFPPWSIYLYIYPYIPMLSSPSLFHYSGHDNYDDGTSQKMQQIFPFSKMIRSTSCLGMHLFGGKFCTRTDGSREPCTCGDLIFDYDDEESYDPKENVLTPPGDDVIDTAVTIYPFTHSLNKRCVCDRKNFNSFLWATITVFQVSSVLLFSLFHVASRKSAWYDSVSECCVKSVLKKSFIVRTDNLIIRRWLAPSIFILLRT